VLHERGRISSSQVARMLGLAPSSVTRVADRLGATELIERGSMPEDRGVVTLSLRPAGTRLVLRVLQRRPNEFAQVLDRLEPDSRRAAAEALREIHALLGDNQTVGPVH
jgi:DNA-binding MarR family transcriptional regulator